jgi:hypothetical protein
MESYETLLNISKRVNWRIDDILGEFDFSRPFLPEAFARTSRLTFLSPGERLILNHIRAREYLALFELVESFLEPFVMKESAQKSADAFREVALRQFAEEETKHMEMFRRVLQAFDETFGVDCGLIGPAADIRSAILAHDDLAVLILALHLEWMSQGHYVESVRDDEELDAQFKSLLRNHWVEECQHARLDGLMLAEMVSDKTSGEVEAAVGQYLEMVAFFDGGFREQAKLDCAAFESAAGRKLADDDRDSFLSVQHQALRWTFLGSAMRNHNFIRAIGCLGDSTVRKVYEGSATFN